MSAKIRGRDDNAERTKQLDDARVREENKSSFIPPLDEIHEGTQNKKGEFLSWLRHRLKAYEARRLPALVSRTDGGNTPVGLAPLPIVCAQAREFSAICIHR